MIKRMKYVVGFAASLVLGLCLTSPVFAQEVDLTAVDYVGTNSVIAGELTVPSADSNATIARAIIVGLGFLGILSIILVLMGGFKYLVSGGSTEHTDDARKYIISGIVGLAMVLALWAITTYVFTGLLSGN